uniref:Uncharacterized protein n=1 Tax=Anguilla anguilla TaxID=7936 RepID=A0A0E9TP85_ANGAN
MLPIESLLGYIQTTDIKRHTMQNVFSCFAFVFTITNISS